MQSPVSTLSPRQAAYVDHLLTGCSATVAATRAGFSPRSARQIAVRLMSKASVKAEIQARQAADSQRLQIDREGVIAGLLEAIAEARVQANPAAIIAGWKAIASMLGLMAPVKHQVDARVGGLDELGRLKRMTDAELLAMMASAG